ncbi:MAG: CoA transferase [Chloroflexi bacterium]|nr:CoA transferase [Chloroflexota bacterium]
MVPLPLEGVRALDLSEVWAGPMATSLLGDLGAEVIKVESFPRAPTNRPAVAPPGGRWLVDNDTTAPRPWDRNASHNMCNRNKLGITLDLSRPLGKDLFQRLVAVSDVLVAGYSAGTMRKMGLAYEVLREVQPGLVMVGMPGWGEAGPCQGYVTLGNSIDAYVGHHLLRGYPGTDPSVTLPCVHSDAVVAVTVAFAVMAALHYRERTGKGQFIDVSHAEALIPHLAWPYLDFAMNGRTGEQLGNRDRAMAPHGCYPCRGTDAWAVIAVRNDAEFAALCRAIGHPELAQDPRFADALGRVRHQDALDAIIAEWTRQHDHYDVMAILQRVGVPAGPVLADYEALSDPQLAARGFFETVTQRYAGTHRYPGMLWKMSATPLSVRIPPSPLGEYNAFVYGELLGLSEADVLRLQAEGYIGTEYAPDAGMDPEDRAATRSI